MRLTLLLKRVLSRAYSDATVPRALRSVKPKSTRDTVQFFIDSCRVRAVAGNGGDGCISFLSVWCKEYAGPDGGDGGNGGHVIFKATHTVKSLNHCATVITAKHGEKGYNKDCCGKNAQHVIVPVPLGTIVMDTDNKVVGDLCTEGMMFVAARGGSGGRGNKFFLSATEQAPDVAELGAPGETASYSLRVRSMAHVGLLGLPNAGKSTVLRAVTRARPAVAPYPFTTLRPHVGVVRYEDLEQVTVADLPGIVHDAHRDRGLGLRFLQHAQRTCGLLYVLDASLPRPWDAYDLLRNELKHYDPALLDRRSCVVANKMDLPEAVRNLPALKKHLRNVTVVPISAKMGSDLDVLLREIRIMYDEGLRNQMPPQ